jgi:hypothetical protein
MINPDKYYIVVTHRAAFGTGLDEAEIRNRLCMIDTPSVQTADHFPGQHTTIEDDGKVHWTVTRSQKQAPDGKKLMAFVVGSRRYKPEPATVQSHIIQRTP